MIRETSIRVYNQIKSEGLLSKMRLRVYEAILNNAPCTSGEALSSMLKSDNVLSQSRARFTELRDRGVIKEIGQRSCNITGRRAIIWDLTDELPTEPEARNIRPRGFKKSIEYMIKKMVDNNLDTFTLQQLIDFNETI